MSHADNDDLASTLRTVAVAVTILFVLFVILGSLVGPLIASGDNERVDTTGSTISIDDQAEAVSLVDSTGSGLAFGRSTGGVEAGTDGGVGDGNSSVSVFAELDDAVIHDDWHVTNLGNGAASIQLRNGSWYAYYNQSAGGVAEVSATASTPRDLTQVGFVANGSHLSLVEDGAVVADSEFDGTSNATVPSARSWWGDQDELVVWDTPLNDSQLQEHEQDPILPVAQDEITARLMLDEGSGGSTYVLVDGSSASLEGDVGWTSGLDGQRLVEGQDYTRNENGTLTILSGSRLDSLRVAYVSYSSWGSEVVGVTSPALILAGAIPILLIAGVILREVSGFGNNGNNGKRI